MTLTERAKLGGLRRVKLYGNPGTAEGRSKGGKKTVQFFHLNPALAKTIGFVMRKEINYPERSPELAELIGIMLGDGGLPGNHQLTISFNYLTDKDYSRYICSIFEKLFSIGCSIHKRKNSNGADVVVNSSNLVDFLVKQGLVTGNKTRNQADIPSWIKGRAEYQIACLRGLVDTDGGLYTHKYRSNGKYYRYAKLCFTNHSGPLLNSVLTILTGLNFKAYLGDHHVSIYAASEVRRYFREVGSHNLKHVTKFERHFAN